MISTFFDPKIYFGGHPAIICEFYAPILTKDTTETALKKYAVDFWIENKANKVTNKQEDNQNLDLAVQAQTLKQQQRDTLQKKNINNDLDTLKRRVRQKLAHRMKRSTYLMLKGAAVASIAVETSDIYQQQMQHGTFARKFLTSPNIPVNSLDSNSYPPIRIDTKMYPIRATNINTINKLKKREPTDIIDEFGEQEENEKDVQWKEDQEAARGETRVFDVAKNKYQKKKRKSKNKNKNEHKKKNKDEKAIVDLGDTIGTQQTLDSSESSSNSSSTSDSRNDLDMINEDELDDFEKDYLNKRKYMKEKRKVGIFGMIVKVKDKINDKASDLVANLVHDKDYGQQILGNYSFKELIWYRDNIYIPSLYQEIMDQEVNAYQNENENKHNDETEQPNNTLQDPDDDEQYEDIEELHEIDGMKLLVKKRQKKTDQKKTQDLITAIENEMMDKVLIHKDKQQQGIDAEQELLMQVQVEMLRVGQEYESQIKEVQQEIEMKKKMLKQSKEKEKEEEDQIFCEQLNILNTLNEPQWMAQNDVNVYWSENKQRDSRTTMSRVNSKITIDSSRSNTSEKQKIITKDINPQQQVKETKIQEQDNQIVPFKLPNEIKPQIVQNEKISKNKAESTLQDKLNTQQEEKNKLQRIIKEQRQKRAMEVAISRDKADLEKYKVEFIPSPQNSNVDLQNNIQQQSEDNQREMQQQSQQDNYITLKVQSEIRDAEDQIQQAKQITDEIERIIQEKGSQQNQNRFDDKEMKYIQEKNDELEYKLKIAKDKQKKIYQGDLFSNKAHEIFKQSVVQQIEQEYNNSMNEHLQALLQEEEDGIIYSNTYQERNHLEKMQQIEIKLQQAKQSNDGSIQDNSLSSIRNEVTKLPEQISELESKLKRMRDKEREIFLQNF
ncbi:MAG: hypothetical protein EZS28_004684, partial [Streblomastix strix]